MKDRIKLVRTNANLNIRQFGECIGTTPASVSRYESGERIPSNAVLLAISREFHVSLAWLKTGEG
ncbi:MAG: helix-turn-helix transcriptional regulator, partial [Firmicutes bacterium]|nr:helix-turn-helix transcriptional regulator [Bacillota bacterium]